MARATAVPPFTNSQTVRSPPSSTLAVRGGEKRQKAARSAALSQARCLCDVCLCPSGDAAPFHCRRRKPERIEDIHAGVLCHPRLALPGESLREHRKGICEAEGHFKFALLWREGVSDRKAGNPFRREPSLQGQEFDRADLRARSHPASRARDGKILSH